MPYNIRIVSTYPPRRCGIGTFSRDLAGALSHFTGEVGHIRVAAIDYDHLPYNIPVDLVIDQCNPDSWKNCTKDIITRANESIIPTIVLLQHEYGLDPDGQGREAQGTNFIEMAKVFEEKGLTTFVYLHTVLDEPNEHQKMVLQELSRYCQALIVTTESAIQILESKTYGIDHNKLKHIDHGIRMQHPSQYDRLAVKKELGLEGSFLVLTLGLLSPDKGIQYGIGGYGRFLNESCSDGQRRQIVYLIAGQCHPEFSRGDSQSYRQFQDTIKKSLEDAKVRYCTAKDLKGLDFQNYDCVFLDAFLDDSFLLKLYGAANAILLPYLNMQQISSGILADTMGSGRVAIATKFRYALELIHSNQICPAGVVIGRHARGILVDSGEDSVDQIAEALDYLVFDETRRLRMEKQAHERGYQMRWQNTAWALLQHVDFVREGEGIVTGRGIKFTRENHRGSTRPVSI